MIVFVSNYYNHHQSPFCNEMYKLTKGEFRFIATEPMENERITMGWGGETAPFIMENYRQEAECQKLIYEADVVIFGSAPRRLFENRLNNGKLTFMYSERPYKKKFEWYKLPVRIIRNYKRFGRYKKLFLLCSSAYTASDYALTGTFLRKTYKWGYFPELKEYSNIDGLIEDKDPTSILWVARFIDWKHPETIVKIASLLKHSGYDFHINMIGNGEMEEDIRKMIAEYQLEDCISMLGTMKPSEVRLYMEKSQIFLFTSDRNEGWGAVLNESMNSGCAVVANKNIGSVPFLVKQGYNGFVYETDEQLLDFVKQLLEDRQLCGKLGKNAYQTIKNEWNAQVSATRLIKLIDSLEKSNGCDSFEKGPCSRA